MNDYNHDVCEDENCHIGKVEYDEIEDCSVCGKRICLHCDMNCISCSAVLCRDCYIPCEYCSPQMDDSSYCKDCISKVVVDMDVGAINLCRAHKIESMPNQIENLQEQIQYIFEVMKKQISVAEKDIQLHNAEREGMKALTDIVKDNMSRIHDLGQRVEAIEASIGHDFDKALYEMKNGSKIYRKREYRYINRIRGHDDKEIPEEKPKEKKKRERKFKFRRKS